MKLLRLATAFLLVSYLSGCSPKIVTTLSNEPLAALAPDAPVLVLSIEERDPPGCQLIGDVFVGEAGTTSNCGLRRMVDEAVIKARQHGANVLKLTDIIPPGTGSTCWQIRGEILFAKDLEILKAALRRRQVVQEQSRLPAGTPYAMLYVYRPRSLSGTNIDYDLHLNDSVVFRVRHEGKAAIRLPKAGPVTVWAQIKDRHYQQTLQVEPGKEYFLHCEVITALFESAPWFDFVSSRQGREEYEQTVGRP